MATFGDIQAAVSTRLLDPDNRSVTLSNVASSINDSISYWKYKRFWFNEVADTATLTAQSASFPYPADFLVPATEDDGFYIAYSGIRYPLVKVNPIEYDSIYQDNGYGMPEIYSRIANNQYQCFPIPDQNYTLGRYYLKNYNSLVNASDTNDFTIYADRLITLWTLADLCAEFQQDEKMSQYYRDRAREEYKNLGVMNSKSNATGSLVLYSDLI